MSKYQFIKKHRAEIDQIIQHNLGAHVKLNDAEREEWIMNDEGLYNWAKSEGVNV